MTFHDASKDFELDCKVRHLSPKTIDNYTKQLRYLEKHLSSEFSVLNIEDVKPSHIKSFMAMMDDAGRKPQYINDLLKVFKTFFTYLESEGYIKTSPAKRIRNMKLALPVFEPIVESDQEKVGNFLEAYAQAQTGADKLALMAAAAKDFDKAPAPRGLDDETKAWKDAINDVRNEMKGSKGILATAAKRLESMLDEKNEQTNAVIQRELRGLELIVRETAKQYEQQKLEAGAIDYADMEQIAYSIMSDPDKRNELLAKYKYIYVDECQDVSGIQDAIIKSLTGPGHQFFMVGDIKQSIYGFRHAEPDLFEHERRTYSDEETATERRIFFMDNYRSCKSVVDAVNEVFTEAMDRRITDMDYIPEDNLRCNLPGEFGPIDVILVKKGDEEADKLEAQCEAVGRYIQSVLTPTTDTSSKQNYQYKDIVILVRTAKGTASTIVDHLKKMHIPAMYEGVPDFFGLAEVKSFLSLLTVIDNLHNDDALVGTLINTPFHFTDQELADIRLEKLEHVPFYEAFELCTGRNEKPIDQKCRKVADQLAAWRKVSESMPVPDFVWWLMRETGTYAARGAYPDGKARQANLDALYQRALDGQKAGNMRLSDFVNDLREARETRQSDSDDHPAMGAGDNFVRVMTMHKSKGLEFPVVILMDLQKNLRRKRNDEKLRMNVSSSGGALGLYLPAIRRNRNSSMDSQGKDICMLFYLYSFRPFLRWLLLVLIFNCIITIGSNFVSLVRSCWFAGTNYFDTHSANLICFICFQQILNITLPRFFLGYLLILTYVFLALSASYTVIFNLRFREESDIA